MSGTLYFYTVEGRAIGAGQKMSAEEAEGRNEKLASAKNIGRWVIGLGQPLTLAKRSAIPDVVIDKSVPSNLPATLYAALLGQYEVVELDRNYKSIPMWKAKMGRL
jgi:hypothetical protein